jgi:uncharacterized protein (DUF885 family)
VNETLAALATEYWEYVLERGPSQALMLGDHRYDDRHEDLSREAEDADVAARRQFSARAAEIDPEGLDSEDRITREVLIFLADGFADLAETHSAEWAVNHTVGMQAWLPVEFPQYPLTKPEHAEAMPSKMRGIARAFEDAAERLREGVAAGRTPMRSTAEKSVSQMDDYLAAPVDNHPFGRFRSPPDWDGEPAWRQEVAATLESAVLPALRTWRDTVESEVVPAARSDDEAGLCFIPDGEQDYQRAVAFFTTTDRTPEAVHQLGLEQTERLAEEYRAIGGEVVGTTDLKEIYTRLRDDPALHFEDGPSIVAASVEAMAKARAAIGDWFGRLPVADCVVEETPTGPLAFYFRPAADGSRPGTFFINTSEPRAWGTYEVEALAFHEGIPGHHLQLAISNELTDVPDFRKHAFISAYGEGWGLYTERLADEMGLYGSALDRIGMLSFDSMRAGRLVVDTGIHAMGWSRQKAIDYLRDNSPLSVTTIEGEVDRYIGMPGQALSYMIGRLEIQRMRREAEERMGAAFDIKGFHDTVLGSGLVPLGTLDRMVKEWAA